MTEEGGVRYGPNSASLRLLLVVHTHFEPRPASRREARGATLSDLVNELLRADIALIEAAG